MKEEITNPTNGGEKKSHMERNSCFAVPVKMGSPPLPVISGFVLIMLIIDHRQFTLSRLYNSICLVIFFFVVVEQILLQEGFDEG